MRFLPGRSPGTDAAIGFVTARSCCLIAVLLWTSQSFAQTFHAGKADAPKAGTLFSYPERVALRDGGMFSCRRGLLFVPLNRSKQSSDVIAVEFYLFPRSSRADPKTPPIFILKGGPGFPGLESDLNERGTLERAYLHFLDISDVIVVGQRGIGSSKPNTVVEELRKSVPADGTYNNKQAVEEFRETLSRERQYWIDQGVDLSGFNVMECAADVRELAKALGYQKIIVYGGSFGSHLGMTLMRTDPELVVRAILTGIEGPDHTWDHPGWIWNVYKRVAKDAEAAKVLKASIPTAGLIATMESLVERAKKKPLQVTIYRGQPNEATALLDGPAMQHVARGISRRLRDWPAEVIQMFRGNFANAAVATLRRAKERPRGFSTASYWMLDSSSGISLKRRAEIEADPAALTLGDINWRYSTGSTVWKTDLGEEFRSNTETNIPTVIVHGTWDTQTPFENALEMAPYFKNHKFVTVKRGTHAALLEAQSVSAGFRRALRHFIKTGETSSLPSAITLREPRWTVPK